MLSWLAQSARPISRKYTLCSSRRNNSNVTLSIFWVWISMSKWRFLFLFLIFLILIYFWERAADRQTDSVSGGRGRERGRHRIWSRLQALSCQHRSQRGAWIHRLRDHDLSRSWMLNWLSHPGSPRKFLVTILSNKYSTPLSLSSGTYNAIFFLLDVV